MAGTSGWYGIKVKSTANAFAPVPQRSVHVAYDLEDLERARDFLAGHDWRSAQKRDEFWEEFKQWASEAGNDFFFLATGSKLVMAVKTDDPWDGIRIWITSEASNFALTPL